MKYLFFDCESLDIKHEYSYSFGYVLTDEQFNVLKQEDILFNPECKKEDRDWFVVKNMMSYDLKEVNNKPTFPHFYDKIKNLMEDEDTLCVGFQVDEDVKYMINNCKRYDLEEYHYKYVDVRTIIKSFTGKKSSSLSSEYIKVTEKLPEDAHASMYDAYMTMIILKNIFEKNNLTKDNLFDEDRKLILNSDDFKNRVSSREKYLVVDKINNIKYPIKLKKLDETSKNSIIKWSKNYLLFCRFLDTVERKDNSNNVLANKKVCISLNYEKGNFKNMIKLIQLIKDCGGEYVLKASQCDLFVSCEFLNEENEEKRQCSRLKYVKKANENGANIEIVEFDDFLNLLGVDRQKLEEIPEMDYCKEMGIEFFDNLISKG